MRRITRIHQPSSEERHRIRRALEEQARRFDRIRDEATIRRGWI